MWWGITRWRHLVISLWVHTNIEMQQYKMPAERRLRYGFATSTARLLVRHATATSGYAYATATPTAPYARLRHGLRYGYATAYGYGYAYAYAYGYGYAATLRLRLRRYAQSPRASHSDSVTHTTHIATEHRHSPWPLHRQSHALALPRAQGHGGRRNVDST